MSAAFTFSTNTLTPGLQALRDKLKMNGSSGSDFRIKSKIALQFLQWTNQGSPREQVVPPIATGNLRGSASVFVGPVLIQTTRGEEPDGTPATDTDERNMDNVTIVYNTAYAAKLHESMDWTPGGNPPNKEVEHNPAKVANVGNKWVEKHMKADAQAFFQMYADLLKAELGG